MLPQDSFATLVAGGLLPGRKYADDCVWSRMPLGTELLSRSLALGESLRLSDSDQRERDRVQQLLCDLNCWYSSGARLTWGIPGSTSSAFQDWLGNRILWWPNGVPEGERTAIVSSRLGRRLEEKQDWFEFFRDACANVHQRGELLISASSTTTGHFVEQATSLFSQPGLIFHIGQQKNLASWWHKLKLPTANDARPLYRAFVSPEIVVDNCAGNRQVSDAPARDRVVIAGSDRIIVVQMRRKGNLQRLIRARLTDGNRRWRPGSTIYTTNAKLISRQLQEWLTDKNGVAWHTPNRKNSQSSVVATSSSAKQRHSDVRTPSFLSPTEIRKICADIPYLTHCTRRQDSDWPGAARASYIDALILGRKEAQHGAIDALTRIIRSKRLAASSLKTRGTTAVVSLTSVFLDQISKLRHFQTHLARWDFEPYGISIEREWLMQQGARPVLYGDDDTWDQLSPPLQPFFQLRGTRDRNGITNRQWETEREWRHIGDIVLDTLPANKAFVFVPSASEAQRINRISRWPVAVLSPNYQLPNYQANRLLRRC
ncbi:MAG: hypothetical protein MK179_09275 [Pirellulaceae bacterium]|nr:hypothetical protein [Pirellulaceae bacterium]